MLASVVAMVAGLVVCVLSAIKVVSSVRDARDPIRADLSELKRLEKSIVRLETRTAAGLKDIGKVQKRRVDLLHKTAKAMREIEGLSDDEITKRFRDLY